MNLHNALSDVRSKYFKVDGHIFTISNNDYSTLSWSDDNSISKPTEEELVEEAARLETLEGYQEPRRMQYPALSEQFDMQYWDQINGTTTWKDAIAKVKADNPKPDGWKE